MSIISKTKWILPEGLYEIEWFTVAFGTTGFFCTVISCLLIIWLTSELFEKNFLVVDMIVGIFFLVYWFDWFNLFVLFLMLCTNVFVSWWMLLTKYDKKKKKNQYRYIIYINDTQKNIKYTKNY